MPRTVASEITASLVGQEVRRARKAAGLTQSEVAERLATSPAYLTNVEAGRLNLTLGQLARIASAVGATLDLKLRLIDLEPAQVSEPLASG